MSVVKQIKKWTVQFDIILFQYLDDWLNVLITHSSSHTSIDTPLYATRTPSQRDKVGDRTNAIHSVPWREVGSPPQPILSHSRAKAGHPIEHRSCDLARRPPILQSGVATRSTGLRISDSSIRSPSSPQSTDKSNSGGLTRSRSRVMDISTRPASGSSPMVIEGGFYVGGDVVSSGRDRSSGFHGRVHKRMGHIMRRSKLARKVTSSRASREMRTVLVALQVLQFRLRRRAVRIWIDNFTTVAYLRKEGGTRSQALFCLSHRILKFAYDLQIRMYPQHIAGHLNVLADLASRTGQVIPSEWTVATPTFSWICESSTWGPPDVEKL